MGVFCQPINGYVPLQYPDLPYASPSVARLFFEFLNRLKELRKVRLKEKIWLIFSVLSALLTIFSLNLSSFFLAFLVFFLLLLYISFKKYLYFNEKANHLYINVHILHHHLIGKLEVGFCEHEAGCSCANNFRAYVWENYRISLYGEQPEQGY